MGHLSEAFEEKYGENASAIAETVLLDFPVKSSGMENGLVDYFEKRMPELEVGEELYKEFVEALADNGYTLPQYAKMRFDPMPAFEIPNVEGRIPKSKGLLFDFKNIVGLDDLRPSMMGVFVDEKGFVVGTDAHKLISVKTDELSHHAGQIINLKRYIDSAGKRVEYIDEKYPNYASVIPSENEIIQDVDLISLNNYLAGCVAITKNVKVSGSFNVNLTLGKVAISFNLSILHDVVKFFLTRGFNEVNFEYSGAARAIVIKSKRDEIWGVVMPVYSGTDEVCCTKRMTLSEIHAAYHFGKKTMVKSKPRNVEVKKKGTSVTEKYDLSQLSGDEQVQAKELIDAIETLEFLLDSMFSSQKMATGGIVEAFSSPQLVDGMYGSISVFAQGGTTSHKQIALKFSHGGKVITREQKIDAYRQMLSNGGQTYAEASEQWNKSAGLPTKKEVMNFIKEHPEVLLEAGGLLKKK